jgi:hypothetical protein
MRSLVKATLLAATFLATGTVINAQVSIGIVIAPPPLARVVVLRTDDKFSFKFDEPGTYEYYCSIHPKMRGKVIVQ